eukprot:m.56175 g.56175  ORF g.56175 m.56175 type:complete len:548 (+) comp34567_c0_seq4:64-1707(+)
MEGQVKELTLRLPKHPTTKFNVMRMNVQSQLDLSKLKEPTLVRKQPERGTKKISEKEKQPEFGEGSEYGREQREQAWWRRRGYVPKEISLDDYPFLLQESGRKGKSFVGRREGGVNTSSAYYILLKSADGGFEAHPVNAWYNFSPTIAYRTLDVDEAEEQFSQRNKTRNYFAIMAQKKMKVEEDEEGKNEREKEDEEKKIKEKKLQVNDDWMDSTDEENDDEDENSRKGKKSSGKKKNRNRQKKQERVGEEGSDQEDPDALQSNELDYISNESSEEEEDKRIDLLKRGQKEKEDDKKASDEEEDRPEDVPEKRSDDEDEDEDEDEENQDKDDDLTDCGRETKKLLKGQKDGDVGGGEREDGKDDFDEDIDVDDDFDADKDESVANSVILSRADPSTSSSSSASSAVGSTADKTQASAAEMPPPPKKRKVESHGSSPAVASASSVKTTKMPMSTPVVAEQRVNQITANAVERYLSLKPMTTKDLLKKFKRKTDLDGEKIVLQLGEILRKINPHQEKIQGKVYLSLRKQQKAEHAWKSQKPEHTHKKTC